MATKKLTFDPEAGVAYSADLTLNTGADFTGTFEEAQKWATDKWDSYDLMAEVHPLYGGTGFELQDENGKTWMTHRTG